MLKNQFNLKDQLEDSKLLLQEILWQLTPGKTRSLKVKVLSAAVGSLFVALGLSAAIILLINDFTFNQHFTIFGYIACVFGCFLAFFGYMIAHKGLMGVWL